MLLLLGSIIPSSGQGIGIVTQTGLTTLETDSLVVEIRGDTNVPQFFFWQPGNDTDTYKLQLDSVFEILDNDSDGAYTLGEDKLVPNSIISLTSFTWDFSEFDLVNSTDGNLEQINFNITSVPTDGPGSSPNDVNDNDLLIQFRVHMDIANETQLKFDIVMNNYNFTDDDALLVVAFKLLTTDNKEIKQDGYRLEFGEAFFHSESSANDSNGERHVGISQGEEQLGESPKIYLAYEHFEGLMVHDPTIGFTSTIVDDDNTTDQNSVIDTSQTDTDQADNQLVTNLLQIFPELSKGALISSTLIATGLFLVIPALIIRSKRK